MVLWVSSTPDAYWETVEEQSTHPGSPEEELGLSGFRGQKVEGFGGCFNEQGWVALSGLDEQYRAKVMSGLFSEDGCTFNFCRVPIGANDYALEWYSANETREDLKMEQFNIKRDLNYLIPYIKEAQQYTSDMRLLASPWSPPTWMKQPSVYNYGVLRWEDDILKAYALYFLKFVQAYRKEGIEIHQIHVQNEPDSNQKFPSCCWTATQLKVFIRDYLGPLFAQEDEKCEIWLGTLERGDHGAWADVILSDPQARKYIAGVGYQWAGKGAVQRTHDSWPNLRILQTESECGDGQNTWEYAQYTFSLMRHYFRNGAVGYLYWNMVLPPGGESSWGWKQNSLLTVDAEQQSITYNPEYYIMKHFSHFVKEGAQLLGLQGSMAGNALAFENPNGEIVLLVSNPLDEKRAISCQRMRFSGFLAPRSVNTIVFSP